MIEHISIMITTFKIFKMLYIVGATMLLNRIFEIPGIQYI